VSNASLSVAKPDPAICPLCGGPNACAMTAGETDEPCWCTQVIIEPRVLALVPTESRGMVCVCAACAAGGAVAVDAGDE
jgi:hypothetical protein